MSHKQYKPHYKKYRPNPFYRKTPEEFHSAFPHNNIHVTPDEALVQKYEIDRKLEELVLALPDNVLFDKEWKNKYRHVQKLYHDVCSIGNHSKAKWHEKYTLPLPSYLLIKGPKNNPSMITNSIFVNACRAFITSTKFKLYNSKDQSEPTIAFKHAFQKHLELKEWVKHVITTYNQTHGTNTYKKKPIVHHVEHAKQMPHDFNHHKG